MLSRLLFPTFSLLAVAAVAADESALSATATAAVNASEARPQSDAAQVAAKPDTGPKALSGMSILGNQEAPKALVIVPWKSSQQGDALGVSRALDDGRQPVDKEVFMRELSYYEIRANSR